MANGSITEDEPPDQGNRGPRTNRARFHVYVPPFVNVLDILKFVASLSCWCCFVCMHESCMHHCERIKLRPKQRAANLLDASSASHVHCPSAAKFFSNTRTHITTHFSSFSSLSLPR